MCERRLGEDVVGDPLSELRERVRRARRDEEEVCAVEVRIQVLGRGPPRKRAMLADKNVDLVVYNDVSRSDIGFDSKDNEVLLITRKGEKRIAKAPKSRIAAAVLDEAVALLHEH